MNVELENLTNFYGRFTVDHVIPYHSFLRARLSEEEIVEEMENKIKGLLGERALELTEVLQADDFDIGAYRFRYSVTIMTNDDFRQIHNYIISLNKRIEELEAALEERDE